MLLFEGRLFGSFCFVLVFHSLFAELTLTMYFSVSPQAYLDSLEGNTNTNTIIETVPPGSLTFSINKENLAFWRNVLYCPLINACG